MITVEQREALLELVVDYRDAWAHQQENGGSEACSWVWASEGALTDFLDSITETPKDA